MRISRLISIFFVASLFASVGVGCTIVEKVDVSIVYAPQFSSKFNVENSPVEIKSARLFIYNSDDLLMRDTLLLAAQLTGAEPLLLVKGIAAGAYRMVSYYNAERMAIVGDSVGVSKIDDLKLNLVNQNKRTSNDFAIDSLCYSFVPFVVQRGDPTILTTEIQTAHYVTTVRITGLDRPTVPTGPIGVELLDLPSSIDAMTGVGDRYNFMIPLETVSPAEQAGRCMCMRFAMADQVKLRVLERGESIQTLVLEPERYLSVGMPSNRLNIEVQFYANSYMILVNDWKIGEFEIIDVGG